MNRNLRSNKFNTLAFGNEQLARAQRPFFIKLNQNWRLKHLVIFFSYKYRVYWKQINNLFPSRIGLSFSPKAFRTLEK